jgi:hypothetical protein
MKEELLQWLNSDEFADTLNHGTTEEIHNVVVNKIQQLSKVIEITGNEPAYPGKLWGQQEYTGMTIYQKAVLDFMCAFIHSPATLGTAPKSSKGVAEFAEIYAKAYIEIINK